MKNYFLLTLAFVIVGCATGKSNMSSDMGLADKSTTEKESDQGSVEIINDVHPFNAVMEGR